MTIDPISLRELEKLMGMSKENLAFKFEMKDIGLMHYFLGLEVW